MAIDRLSEPHLLYVAWGFPPSRAGGVHRALATANAFAGAGWDVTVLTAPREVFAELTGLDESGEALVDSTVDVVRVPFSWPARRSDVRTFSPGRLLFPRLWAKTRERLDTLTFPEVGYGPWRRKIEQAALAVHARHPVDLVIGTTNPHVAVTPGLRLHGEHGVPHVVDCRDAWSLNTYTGMRAYGTESPVGRWEARTFASAAEIWFVNEPLRRWHAQVYPDDAARMLVVMNGYDDELPPPTLSSGHDQPLRFGYVGTITPVMPLREFVEGWRYGCANEPALAHAEADLCGYLGYFATPDPAVVPVIDTAKDAGIHYLGPIPKAQVATAYAGFDALVLILGGGEYITSGKVFEYMSTGLPVVSVLTPGTSAADVLQEYPRWHPAADLTPIAIAAALAAAAADARDCPPLRVDAAQVVARQFQRDRLLAPRLEALHSLVSVGSTRTPGLGTSHRESS